MFDALSVGVEIGEPDLAPDDLDAAEGQQGFPALGLLLDHIVVVGRDQQHAVDSARLLEAVVEGRRVGVVQPRAPGGHAGEERRVVRLFGRGRGAERVVSGGGQVEGQEAPAGAAGLGEGLGVAELVERRLGLASDAAQDRPDLGVALASEVQEQMRRVMAAVPLEDVALEVLQHGAVVAPRLLPVQRLSQIHRHPSPLLLDASRGDPTGRRRGVKDRLRHNHRLVKISRTTYAASPGGASQIPSAKAALHFARPVR